MGHAAAGLPLAPLGRDPVPVALPVPFPAASLAAVPEPPSHLAAALTANKVPSPVAMPRPGSVRESCPPDSKLGAGDRDSSQKDLVEKLLYLAVMQINSVRPMAPAGATSSEASAIPTAPG